MDAPSGAGKIARLVTAFNATSRPYRQSSHSLALLEETMMKLLASAVSTIAMAVPSLVRDLAGLCGVGLVSYGAWMIYPPAGFITGGFLLIVGTLLIALGNRAAG
jgi:hypothetical protein